MSGIEAKVLRRSIASESDQCNTVVESHNTISYLSSAYFINDSSSLSKREREAATRAGPAYWSAIQIYRMLNVWSRS